MTLHKLMSKYFSVNRESYKEYSSACPWCGGEDRFRFQNYSEKGWRFWCRQCNRKGDYKDILKYIETKIPREEYQALVNLMNTDIRVTSRTGVSNNTQECDREVWLHSAQKLVTAANKWLLEYHILYEGLKNERGLTIDSIKRFTLGHTLARSTNNESEWGFPTNNTNQWLNRIIIPRGIVIPKYWNGDMIGINIRCENGERGRKYHMIRGSKMAPMIIGDISNNKPVMVLESDLDAMLVHQEAGDLIDVISLGSAQFKIDRSLTLSLRKAPLILLSFDKDDAGYNAYRAWKNEYDNSKIWPVPNGKDPGDFWKNDKSIRYWVKAGID